MIYKKTLMKNYKLHVKKSFKKLNNKNFNINNKYKH